MASEPMTRRGFLIPVLIAGLALGALGYAWWASRDDSFSVSSMVNGFERRSELTVFAAQVTPVVTSRSEGVIDLLDSTQTAIVPAEVRYTLDMRAIDAGAVRLDTAARTMTVMAPPVMIQRPDLIEGRARYFRKGVWITDAATDALYRQNSGAAMIEAQKLARNPQLVRMAEDAGRAAVADIARAFLDAAGMRDVVVRVDYARR